MTSPEYERLVEDSSDAVAHVAADGTVLAVTPAMADLLETDGETPVGVDIREVFPGDAGAKHLEAGRRVIETGGAERAEQRLDGHRLRTVVEPVETHRGTDSFGLVARDVTGRSDPERCRERLEDVTSVVSHDLRNPLNVAQSSVELLATECDSDHLERVDRSLVRIRETVDDLVALAREGEPVGDTSPVDLATMAADVWADLETGDVTLEADVDCRIEADTGRLQTLLGHLFENALEHGSGSTERGDGDGGVSTVTVGVTDEGFFVADDGVGIPEDRRGEVFEVGVTTARAGTGLGLNVVREIAIAHGWSVEVSESASGGTRVDIVGVVSA